MLRWDFLCWVCWIDVDTTPWKSIPNSLKTLLDTIYILSKIHTLNTKISTLRFKGILYWFGLETLFWNGWFGNFIQNGLVWKLCFYHGLVWKLYFEMVWFGNSVLKWFGLEQEHGECRNGTCLCREGWNGRLVDLILYGTIGIILKDP